MNIYGVTIVTLKMSNDNLDRLENVESNTKLFSSKTKMEIYLEEIELTDNDEVFTFEDKL